MQFRRVPGRDSAQVVTPFVQVGTSSWIPCSQGDRLCLHLEVSLESPRIAPAMDLSPTNRRTGTEASPRRAQSLRGHTPTKEAEGFPRHYPPSITSSLTEAAGEGFAVMSGISLGSRLPKGQVVCLPDKEFR